MVEDQKDSYALPQEKETPPPLKETDERPEETTDVPEHEEENENIEEGVSEEIEKGEEDGQEEQWGEETEREGEVQEEQMVDEEIEEEDVPNEQKEPDSVDTFDRQKLMEITKLIENAKKTLDEISSIRDALEKTRIIMDEDKEVLEPYQEKMNAWKEEGYNTFRLESALETRLPELIDRVFESYEKDIDRLEEIRKSLDSLDTKGFKKRETDIREKLKDPEEIILTLKHMIELEIDIRRKMEMAV